MNKRGCHCTLAKATRVTLNASCFLAALALTALCLGRFAGSPKDPVITAKLAWWEAHGTEYDTLIIGTSRSYHGIIPRVLDEAMETGGVPVRCFNLAADGMRPPEDDFVLEKALAVPGLRLHTVIVECNEVKSAASDLGNPTPRELYWHDWRRLYILWRKVWAASYDKPQNVLNHFSRCRQDFGEFSIHVRLWLWKSLHLGDGMVRVFPDRAFTETINPVQAIGPRHDGYVEQQKATPMHGEELKDYEENRKNLIKRRPLLEYGDAESQADLYRKRDLIERVGAQMVLVCPPSLQQDIFVPTPSLQRVPFVDFSNPGQYPELYAMEMRRDYGHLNTNGAGIYTRFLAKALLGVSKATVAR